MRALNREFFQKEYEVMKKLRKLCKSRDPQYIMNCIIEWKSFHDVRNDSPTVAEYRITSSDRFSELHISDDDFRKHFEMWRRMRILEGEDPEEELRERERKKGYIKGI